VTHQLTTAEFPEPRLRLTKGRVRDGKVAPRCPEVAGLFPCGHSPMMGGLADLVAVEMPTSRG
jgi:hypothetical protein